VSKPDPFWVVVTVYDDNLPFGHAPILPGAFAWEGLHKSPAWWKHTTTRPEVDAFEALPLPAPVWRDHEKEQVAGMVVAWEDRADALYAQLALDDVDENRDAWYAWHHLQYNCSSSVSMGFVIIEDEGGEVLDAPVDAPTKRTGRITRAAITEVSVMSRWGWHPATRLLIPSEADAMLAGEPLAHKPVEFSYRDRMAQLEAAARG
jgi:hypothetical protein